MSEALEGVVESNSDPVASAPAPAPADEAPASDVNWSDFAGEMDGEDSGDEGAPTAVEGAEEVPAIESQQPPPAPAATPSEPVAAAPPTPVAPPAAEAPPTPPQTPPSPAPEPQAQVKYDDWRKEQVEKLAGVYKLSDEMATQLVTEPEVVLPQILAQLHMSVMESVMQGVTRTLPQMVQEVGSVNTRESEARTIFFGENEDLKDPKFEKAIFQFGSMFRQVNANASPQEAARAIGNLVRTAHGMAQKDYSAGSAPAPSAPTAPVAAPAPAPFVPARGGGSGATPPAAKNPFTQLADEFLASEDY